MRADERRAQVAGIIEAARKDPDITYEQLKKRFGASHRVVANALQRAGLKAAVPDSLGTILRSSYGFRAAVNKYKGKKR